jgi:cytidylate kinase
MPVMAVITISRQIGSGAEAIAQKVSEALEYAFVDTELVSAVAQEAHTDETTIMRFDERGRHPVLHVLMKYVIGEKRIVPAWPTYYYSDEFAALSVREKKSPMSRASCWKLFEDVIEKLWERGDVVIVGRGATAILYGRGDVVSVRITAPLEYRLRRVMLEQGLEHRDAVRLIKRTDKQQARYIRQGYGVKDDKRDLHRLSFDVGITSEEVVVQTICRAVSELCEPEIESV